MDIVHFTINRELRPLHPVKFAKRTSILPNPYKYSRGVVGVFILLMKHDDMFLAPFLTPMVLCTYNKYCTVVPYEWYQGADASDLDLFVQYSYVGNYFVF